MSRNSTASCIEVYDIDVSPTKSMDKDSLFDIKEEIDYTRELLNKVSCDIDNIEKNRQILEVSQYMDKLLNKYTSMIIKK